MSTRAVACLVTLAVLSSSSSCVPSTADADPRGAIALQLRPSPAALGEPIMTSDGWTVHVDAFVLQAFANASGETPDGADSFGKPAQTDVLFPASRPTELVTYAIPAGPASVQIGFSIHGLRPSLHGVQAIRQNNQGVAPELAERFNQPPDIAFDYEFPDGTHLSDEPDAVSNIGGPAFLLIAHAEKAGRTIKLDVSMQDAFPSDPIYGTVVANALTNVYATIAVENLFRDEDDKSAPLLFEDFAAADTNHDGVLSPKELQVAREPCPGCSDVLAQRMTLVQAISRRISNIFVPAPPP